MKNSIIIFQQERLPTRNIVKGGKSMIIALRSDKTQINLFEFTLTDEIVKMEKRDLIIAQFVGTAVRLKTGNKRRAAFCSHPIK